MMKRIPILLLLLLASLPAMAQTVLVGSAGSNLSGTGGEISWSVGEPAVITFGPAGGENTEGFHQLWERNSIVVTAVEPLELCPGQQFGVTFEAAGFYGAENFFIVQLSDLNGSFDQPNEAGSIFSNQEGPQTIDAVAPGLAPGQYQLRVFSTRPATAGEVYEFPVTIVPAPSLSVDPANPAVCLGNAVTLTVSGADNITWDPAPGFPGAVGPEVLVAPSVTTTYTVRGTNLDGGCEAVSQITVQVSSGNLYFVTAVKTSFLTGGPNAHRIRCRVEGGVQPYEYSLDGTTFQSEGRFDNLMSGTETVTARDAGGCTTSMQFILE